VRLNCDMFEDGAGRQWAVHRLGQVPAKEGFGQAGLKAMLLGADCEDMAVAAGLSGVFALDLRLQRRCGPTIGPYVLG
jgi:hypothetical protein